MLTSGRDGEEKTDPAWWATIQKTSRANNIPAVVRAALGG